MKLIENIATRKAYERMDLGREKGVESVDRSQLAEIKETLDSLRSILAEQNQFGTFQIDDDILTELEERVDVIDKAKLQDQHFKPNGDSFTRYCDATVGSRKGKAKYRLNQAFTGNRMLSSNLNGKINIIYS